MLQQNMNRHQTFKSCHDADDGSPRTITAKKAIQESEEVKIKLNDVNTNFS